MASDVTVNAYGCFVGDVDKQEDLAVKVTEEIPVIKLGIVFGDGPIGPIGAVTGNKEEPFREYIKGKRYKIHPENKDKYLLYQKVENVVYSSRTGMPIGKEYTGKHLFQISGWIYCTTKDCELWNFTAIKRDKLETSSPSKLDIIPGENGRFVLMHGRIPEGTEIYRNEFGEILTTCLLIDDIDEIYPGYFDI